MAGDIESCLQLVVSVILSRTESITRLYGPVSFFR